MTALPPDAVADLYKLVAELEQRLDSSFAAHDAVIARQAATAEENAQLRNELGIAREQQAASADILGTIANASGDAAASLQRIAETTARLFDAASVTIRIADGNEWGQTIRLGASGELIDALVPAEQRRAGGRNLPGTVFRENRQIHIPDLDNIDPGMADWPVMAARAAGTRTVAGTPLRRGGEAIGALLVFRDRLAPFTDEELALQQSFADQAAIAIENARLFNETKEALSRQTATADILRVISQSPTDVQPVFDAIVLSAVRLLGCDRSFMLRCDGTSFWSVARAGTEGPLAITTPLKAPIDPDANFPSRAIVQRKTLHLPDWSVIDLPEFEREIHETLGYRSTLYLPLLRGEECVGLLGLARKQAGVFDDNEIALAESFRDQAAIAIENVRLFNETKEALERQTATSDILKVIASSPSDVQPVFDVIVERAVRLCGARMGRVYRYDGDLIHLVGGHGLSVPARDSAERPFPRPASDDTIVGRVMLARRANILADLDEDDTVPPLSRQMISALGARSQVTMPMLLAGAPIGAITLSWAEPRGYTDQTIALLQTFADQAVIAIENVRLFNDVKERTEDLSESLQQQTAVGDVLKIISRSAFDLQPVLDTLVNTAALLCDAEMAFLMRREGDLYRAGAAVGFSSEYIEFLRSNPLRVDRGSITGRAVLERRTVQILDVALDPEYTLRESTTLAGQHTALCVPLLRENEPIGTIVLARQRVEAFTQKQIDLVTTFADQAVIAIENVRLFNEVRQRTEDLSESLQQQTATADVLKVISRSAFDLQTVLDTLVESAAHLCEAESAHIFRRAGVTYHLAACHGYSREYEEHMKQRQFAPGNDSLMGRIALEQRMVHIADVLADPEYHQVESQKLGQWRTMLGVPLLREGTPIGALTLTRSVVRPFTEKQIELITTFADQAVIAIENVRLFDEVQAKTRDLSEALTYQTGSANILKVIASSPTDVGPVLRAIVESACELCESYDAVLRLRDGDVLRFSAHQGPLTTKHEDLPISRSWTTGRAVVDRVPVHVEDMLSASGDEFPEAQNRAREQGQRTVLSVPLLREGESIGAIMLRRLEVNPFSDKQIALLQTFADQAVIAIGNVRLFEEVQAKTRDLTEALTYQTGSANILKVIASSPTDVGPVLKAIVESSCELCGAYDAVLRLKQGDALAMGAHHGPIPANMELWTINRNWTAGRAVLDRSPVHVHDLLSAEGDEFPEARPLTQGHRTVLSVPLLREGESIGAITLRRTEVNPFSDKQITLLQTFADQAVIAIGNVRLFEEVQARTRDLSESLQQQTATADVLQIISSSPGDLTPVFEKMLENATRVCGAEFGSMNLVEDGSVRQVALYNVPAAFAEVRIDRVFRPHPESALATAIRTKQVGHLPDMRTSPAYLKRAPATVELVELGGARTVVTVPLLREDAVIGAMTIYRQEVRPFGDKQIELLSSFAKQAVIAIENARLLKELRQRTNDLTETLEQQTATADVLKVISRSPDALQPVLDAIVETSRELCHSDASTIFLLRDDKFHLAAVSGAMPAHLEFLRANPMAVDQRGSILARVAREKRALHYQNVADDPELSQGTTGLGGPRAIVTVPLMRDGDVIGALTLRQSHLKPFTARQIEAIETFADQAVIAISNVSLFEEVQARTRDLSESLQQQTATADVLRVISASPGELEPVFQTMLENAVRLCEAQFAMLFLYEEKENEFRAVGSWNLPPAYGEFLGNNAIRADPLVPLGRVAITKQPVQVLDVLLDQSYIERYPGMVGIAEGGGARTLLQVPMLREDELVGTIGIYRQEVRPFTDKQIVLVRNFGAQAVIAIENARLLNVLRQRTDDLTKSLDDLRTAQDRLVQTEKLASLGQLTAGIAHEIKNPLNFVNNFAALSAELTDELNDVLKQAEITEKIRGEVDELTGLLKDNLQKVVQHGKRADSIVKNMLLHSREGSGEHRPTDINALVDESLNLAYHGARAEKPDFNVTLQRDFDADAGMIEVFPQEITRVFLNLVSNGFYAVTRRRSEHGPGFDPVLSAATRNLGDAVEIRIRDNGTGIPQDVKDKMFNPFFTTKPAGEGTGLGLSMSHDIIVKQHGGTIDVDTEPGQFTEFRIVLPRISKSSK